MLLNVVVQNVSIRNVKVSKGEGRITYSITKCTASKNIKCTLRKRYKTFCNGIRFVTLYVYILKTLRLKLLHCVQLHFVTLRHLMFTFT